MRLKYLWPGDDFTWYQYLAYYFGIVLAIGRCFIAWFMLEAIIGPDDPGNAWFPVLFVYDFPIGIVFMFALDGGNQIWFVVVALIGAVVGMYWHLAWPQFLARLIRKVLSGLESPRRLS